MSFTYLDPDWEEKSKQAFVKAIHEELMKKPKNKAPGLLDPTQDAIREALAPLQQEIKDLKDRITKLENK